MTRLSATRAGYLDNLSGGAVMLASSYSAPPSAATVASAVRTDPEDVVRCEVLCQWIDLPDVEQVIPLGAWERCCEPEAERDDRIAYSLDAAPDGASGAIAVSDGLTAVVVEHGPGTHWMARKLADLLEDQPGPVFLDPRGPAGGLLPELGELGIEVTEVSAAEHAQACGSLLAAVIFEPREIDGDAEPLRFHHTGQSMLDDAVRGATRRPYSDAGWVWSRRSARTDISPLVAVTLARWGALTAPAEGEDFAMVV